MLYSYIRLTPNYATFKYIKDFEVETIFLYISIYVSIVEHILSLSS